MVETCEEIQLIAGCPCQHHLLSGNPVQRRLIGQTVPIKTPDSSGLSYTIGGFEEKNPLRE